MTERFIIKEIDNFSYGIKVTDVIMDNHIELPQSTVCDLLNNLYEENTRLKAFIKRLTNNCGEIILMNGIGYNVDKILGDNDD